MSDTAPLEPSPDELRQRLNLETGRISWTELQRHFARGVVVIVAPPLDLIQVAACFAQDNKTQVEDWIKTGLVQRALANDARRWQDVAAQFWSCVVAPWVLVQEITPV